MDFFGIGPAEILLILIIALLIFGPQKLPQIGRDLGKTFRSFRKATTELTNELSKEMKDLENEKTEVVKDVKKELDEAPKPVETKTQ